MVRALSRNSASSVSTSLPPAPFRSARMRPRPRLRRPAGRSSIGLTILQRRPRRARRRRLFPAHGRCAAPRSSRQGAAMICTPIGRRPKRHRDGDDRQADERDRLRVERRYSPAPAFPAVQHERLLARSAARRRASPAPGWRRPHRTVAAPRRDTSGGISAP